MRLSTLALLMTVATPTACPTLAEPHYTSDGFTVAADDGHLHLRNSTEATIHYVAVEEETSALIDLYFDPEAWPAVLPGEEIRIPYAEITGYTPAGKEVRIHWWTTGEYRPNLVVPLR